MPFQAETPISASQIANALDLSLGNFGPFEGWWFRNHPPWSPIQGEIITGVKGAATGEPRPTGEDWERRGGFFYSFKPSTLRTIYTLTDFSLLVPQVTWRLEPSELGKPEGEFEFAQNWLVVLKIGGGNYFTTSIGDPTIFTLKSLEKPEEQTSYTIGPHQGQVEFIQTFVVPPAYSIDIQVIPYIQVLRVIKSTTIRSAGIGSAELSSVADASKAPRNGPPATLVYTMETHRRRR